MSSFVKEPTAIRLMVGTRRERGSALREAGCRVHLRNYGSCFEFSPGHPRLLSFEGRSNLCETIS